MGLLVDLVDSFHYIQKSAIQSAKSPVNMKVIQTNAPTAPKGLSLHNLHKNNDKLVFDTICKN